MEAKNERMLARQGTTTVAKVEGNKVINDRGKKQNERQT